MVTIKAQRQMKAPVLLIVFNRLETAQKVFRAIREYEPDQLYVFADGWRQKRPGEEEKCKRVREWIKTNVDWPCELQTNFLDHNVGCGLGPSTAISWFFDHVDSGIILEDDCVPHIDFFDFALELLQRYSDDQKIMAINSSNFQSRTIGDGSYYFSMQNGPFCAWATWKRSWNFFDYSMKKYQKSAIVNSLKRYYRVTKRELKWWMDIYDGLMVDKYQGSSWDYQFIFAIWANRGKSLVPNVNLSTNIGFGPDATHTTDPNSVTANRPTAGILPVKHPTDTTICRSADLFYHDFYYDRFVDHTSWFKKFKRFVKRLIKRKLTCEVS